MDKKQAYQEKLEAQLDEWNAKVAELQAKADGAAADAKITYQEQVDALVAKRDAAQEKLTALKQAGEGAWEDLKTGIELAWNDLRSSLESAVKKFK